MSASHASLALVKLDALVEPLSYVTVAARLSYSALRSPAPYAVAASAARIRVTLATPPPRPPARVIAAATPRTSRGRVCKENLCIVVSSQSCGTPAHNSGDRAFYPFYPFHRCRRASSAPHPETACSTTSVFSSASARVPLLLLLPLCLLPSCTCATLMFPRWTSSKAVTFTLKGDNILTYKEAM